MTSEERRQRRYVRRVARRRERMLHAKLRPDNYERKCRRTGGRYNTAPKWRYKCPKWKLRVAGADDFERVMSFEHLWESYRLCRKRVAWKGSVQRYITRAPIEISNAHASLMSGKYRSGKYYEFVTYERGKRREIKSYTMRDRVIRRCFCDYALVPRICRSFIYDNGASMETKGYHFALNRIIRHLHEYYRENGSEGYVLTFDFSKFFDSVSHANVKAILRKTFSDQRIVRFADAFIDEFGDVGLGLGSDVSQIIALVSANALDHMFKEQLGIKRYGRYMDDGYLIHKDKKYLQYCLERIKVKCRELGITLNEKKTQIIKLSHGFTFLKARLYLLPSGKVIKKIYKRSVTRMRQKLKKLRQRVDAGKMTEQSVYQAYRSWRDGYAANFNARRTIRNMDRLYLKLYKFHPPELLKEAA